MKAVTTERGWKGHLCVSRWCQFSRNTLIEVGEARVVVSTIGRYLPKNSDEYDTVGSGRYHETMAFVATIEHGYWDADISQEYDFDGKRQVDHIGETDEQEANDMHDAAVKQVSARLLKEAPNA